VSDAERERRKTYGYIAERTPHTLHQCNDSQLRREFATTSISHGSQDYNTADWRLLLVVVRSTTAFRPDLIRQRLPRGYRSRYLHISSDRSLSHRQQKTWVVFCSRPNTAWIALQAAEGGSAHGLIQRSHDAHVFTSASVLPSTHGGRCRHCRSTMSCFRCRSMATGVYTTPHLAWACSSCWRGLGKHNAVPLTRKLESSGASRAKTRQQSHG
jgi:hypothetical protein